MVMNRIKVPLISKSCLSIITILITMILCTDISGAGTEGFYLKLHLARREKSKDSNSQVTTVEIKDSTVHCAVAFRGHDPRENISKEYRPGEDDMAKLIRYLKDNRLNMNIRENSKCASPGVSISLSLEVIIDNVKTKADVTGTKNFWGRDHGKRSNIKNIDYYNRVHSLLLFMKKELGFDIIEQ